MLDLIVLIAATVLGIAFFGSKGAGQGLTFMFPPATGQRGIRTRTNGYIVLAIMIGALVLTQLHSRNRSLLGFLAIMLGAAIVVFTSYKKGKK